MKTMSNSENTNTTKNKSSVSDLQSTNTEKNKNSVSETGHAKNIANLNILNTHIIALGTIYNPSNPKLLLTNLQDKYTKTFQEQEEVNTLLTPYSVAVDEREVLFQPFNKELTKLKKALKATEGVTQKHLDDFMTVSRKLKGLRKISTTLTNNTKDEQAHHSIAQLSYDQRTNNMDLLISLLENTPNFNPNEAEYKVETYKAKKTLMLQKTQAVANTFIPLNNARSKRNHSMYKTEDNLVDIANKAKDYLFTILDTSSVQYKAISRLQFQKILYK